MLTNFEPDIRRAAMTALELDCHTAFLRRLIVGHFDARRHHDFTAAYNNRIAEDQVIGATVHREICWGQAVAFTPRAEQACFTASIFRLNFTALLHHAFPYCLGATL